MEMSNYIQFKADECFISATVRIFILMNNV